MAWAGRDLRNHLALDHKKTSKKETSAVNMIKVVIKKHYIIALNWS